MSWPFDDERPGAPAVRTTEDTGPPTEETGPATADTGPPTAEFGWGPSPGGPRRPPPWDAEDRARRRGLDRQDALAVLLLVVALLAAVGIGVAFGHLAWRSTAAPVTSVPAGTPVSGGAPAAAPPASVPSTTPGRGSSSGAPPDPASIARSVDPALVDINTVVAAEAIRGAGTGMVIGPKGEVLTNNHVIEGATSIAVTDIGNGRTYPARVVGYDRSQDVAVLRLSGASNLQTVQLASSPVTTGEGVVAVGNAEGAGGVPRYAGGSVTATGQSISAQDDVTGTSEQLSGLIATDAAVLPGDSGGALVDPSGNVVGMVTAGTTGFRFQNAGTAGYAIPIRTATTIAVQIQRRRPSPTVHIGPTPFLGVLVQTPVQSNGAEIVRTLPNSPSGAAGLVAGDIITSLAGQAVTSPESLTEELLTQQPGASVSVGFVAAGGRAGTVVVHLASGPPQ